MTYVLKALINIENIREIMHLKYFLWLFPMLRGFRKDGLSEVKAKLVVKDVLCHF